MMETEVVIIEEFEPIQEFSFTKPKAQKTSNCQCVYGIFIRDELGEYGLQMVEKLLIETLHPKFNKAGVTMPYKFRGTTRRPKAFYTGQEEDEEDIY